jgi:hypothetical protein
VENSASMGSRVTQGSGGGGAGSRKNENVLPQVGGQLRGGARGVLPRHKNVGCRSYGIELAEKKEEEDRDYWFNRSWPTTKPKLTWREND